MTRFITYAIGDVHAMLAPLQALHAVILADCTSIGARARIIHLGDFIDRGPDSRGVIDAVMAFEDQARAQGLEAFSLRGNHEQMMLDALEAPESQALRQWLYNGGDEALASYARTAKRALNEDWPKLIPKRHQVWLKSLPTLFVDEKRGWAFVHAGIDPQRFPHCPDEVRVWTRSERFFDRAAWPDRPELDGLLVVHGHTPNEDLEPEIHPHRINVDTGCVYGGRLSCVALEVGCAPRILGV